MLFVAALLTVAVGLMHSVLGGRRLIEPIAGMDGLPVILGSVERTKLTLRVGWHMLSVTWWGMAVALAYMQAVPETKSALFLWMVAGVFGFCGAGALLLSRGAHLSWLFFLPVSAIAGYVAYSMVA